MERTSLIPSPTMATYLPLLRRESMTFSFCSGLIRPKILVSRAACANSSSFMLSSLSPEMIFLSPGISASLKMASTVSGSSPEMTLISIPWSTNSEMISLQSGLISSLMEITASTFRSGRTISPDASWSSAEPASKRTTDLRPLDESSLRAGVTSVPSVTLSLRKGHAPM